MRAEVRIAAALALVLVAALPPLAPLLQARLATHVLGQYPLIVAGGAVVGAALARGRDAGWSAAPALLAAVLAVAFWLLPRWIDAATTDPAVAAIRAATLAAVAGVPLGWGWRQAGPVLRGFTLANAAAMLGVMGWLQLGVPVRLCATYLIDDQRQFGLGLLAFAGLIIVLGLAGALAGIGPTPDAMAGSQRRVWAR